MRLVFCKGWREQGLFLHHRSLHPAHTVLDGDQGWGHQPLGRRLAPLLAPNGEQGLSTWWSGWANTLPSTSWDGVCPRAVLHDTV